jgi:hypothetical protein
MHNLAHCQTSAATILIRLGKPVQARARCERAVAAYGSLLGLAPNVPDDRRAYAETLLRLGQARQMEGNSAAAASDWRRAIAVLDGDSAAGGERDFIGASCHAMLSSVAGLQGTGLSKSGQDVERDLAIDLLRRAIMSKGLGPEIYLTETALDSLRDRDDFRLLMMDLAMPAKAFAGGR